MISSIQSKQLLTYSAESQIEISGMMINCFIYRRNVTPPQFGRRYASGFLCGHRYRLHKWLLLARLRPPFYKLTNTQPVTAENAGVDVDYEGDTGHVEIYIIELKGKWARNLFRPGYCNWFDCYICPRLILV